MPIALEIDADVIMFCLLVEIFDSGGCEEGFHVKSLLEVLGGRVVGIVGLDEADGGLSRNIQQEDFSLI